MPTKTKKKTNVKKLKMPKVEMLEDSDTTVTKDVVTENLTIPPEPETEKKDPEEVKKSAVQIKAEKEAAEYKAPEPVNAVAEAIVPDVILVPLGTNHRQIRLAFDVRTNKISPNDIPDIVQIVLKKAAPLIGEKLVEAIHVEKTLLNATRQK